MFKIYAEGQYFFMEITGRDEALQDHKANVIVYPLDDATGLFRIKSPLLGNHDVLLANMVDENDVAFTPSTWETFYQTSTGPNAIENAHRGSIDTGSNHINANVVGTVYAICGIRINPLNAGEFAAIVGGSAMGTTPTDNFLIRFYKNPVIAGVVNWNDIPGTPVQSFKAAIAGSNTVSGGEILSSDYFPNQTSGGNSVADDYIGNDEIVMCVVPLGSLLDIFGSINFKF